MAKSNANFSENFMKTKSIFLSISIGFLATFSARVRADNWGCEVLLCLSNPAGPMAVSQCVPPIQRLYAAIFKRRPDPFPTCDMATNANGNRSFASVDYNNYYDPCPSGTKALPVGAFAVQSNMQNYGNFGIGIGEGNGLSPSADQSLSQKVCVGNQVGTTYISTGSGDNSGTYQTGIYDRVVFIDPVTNGYAIKVYINDQLYRVVRP